MTDKEPLQRIHELFGGNLVGPYSEPSRVAKGYKPLYRWSCSRGDHFEIIANLIFPLLSPRRQGQLYGALINLRSARATPIVPGNRLRREPAPYRPRRSGELVCPESVEPSARGYQRHRLLSIPVCDTCRLSANLYHKLRRESWYKEHNREIQRGSYLRHRESRIEQARQYRARSNRKPPTEGDSDKPITDIPSA